MIERRGGENEPVEEQGSGRRRGKESKRQEPDLVYFVCWQIGDPSFLCACLSGNDPVLTQNSETKEESCFHSVDLIVFYVYMWFWV